MRDVKETLEWYKDHVYTREIGFNPDGMCLKVVRTARGIPARYPTAKAAQDATPQEHRITKVRHLRRGMVLYFDDPYDGNRAGHVATMIGRVKGFNPDNLADVLTVTNSVQSGRLTVVRGDYYIRHWGDHFHFGATWLNGYELDMPEQNTRVEKFHDTKPVYNLRILERAAQHRPKARYALDRIMTQVNQLPDSAKINRVRQFKNQVREDKVLNMPLLNEAVEGGRTGKVKRIRDEIRRLINELPEE